MFKRDYADEIKRSVDMPRLMGYYGIEYKRAHIKCPIHGGEGDNFRAYKDGFYCFSRCGGGDVIKFVQLYERLDFLGAVKRIDEIFTLGLFEESTFAEKMRRKREAAKAKAERQALERAREYDRRQYIILADYVRWLHQQPQTEAIRFDLEYMDRLLSKFDGGELITFDAAARVAALKTKHGGDTA